MTGEAEIFGRLNTLELKVAVLEEQVRGFSGELRGLVNLALEVGLVKRDIQEVKDDVREVKIIQVEKIQADKDERRETRRALYVLTGTIVTTVGGVLTALIARGVF